MTENKKLGRRKRLKLEEERSLSRRRFAKKMALGGAAATLVPAGTWWLYEQLTSSPRDVFERGYDLDVGSLPKETSEERSSDYSPTTIERSRYLERILADPVFEGKTISDINLVESSKETWLRLEPDAEYANRLIQEARTSIDHVVEFLGSPYITNRPMRFEVPQRTRDINFGEVPDILFYLVADFGTPVKSTYNLMVDGNNDTVILSSDKDIAGLTSADLKLQAIGENYSIEGSTNMAIFYNTSVDVVTLVEAPAIEFLHSCFREYDMNRAAEDVNNNVTSKDDLIATVSKYVNMGEIFFHALSILWLRQYNQDRGLGLTEEELAARFAKYETETSIYKGTNAMSQHIARIGIPTAIDLYVNNPDELFQILE